MKKAIIFLCCLVLIFTAVPVMNTEASYDSALETIKPYAQIILLVSLDDGSVIFNKNADMVTAPASLTKIVTASIVLQKCKDLNAIVTIPTYAIRMFDNMDSSNAGLMPGEKISVMNLLYCLLVKSANEAAAILADYIAGSIEGFVDMMNTYVKELGCKNTHFVNPHGLDEDGQYTTANDLAKIVKEALKSPVFEKITSTSKYTVPKTNLNGERKLISTVFLMNKGYKDYYCEYATGIKTGTTTGAGHCVISKASKDGYTYLAVILRAPFEDIDNDGVNENCAFVDCKTLFNWTFDNIKLRAVAEPTQVIAEVPVNLSWSADHVQLVPEKEVLALVPAGIDSGSVLIEPIKKSLAKSVDAPVKKGQKMGEARVLYAGEEIARIQLVSSESVSRNGILYVASLVKSAASTFIFKLFASIILAVIAAYAGITVAYNIRKHKHKKLKILNYRDVKKK